MEMVALELIRQIQRMDSSDEYILFARNGPDNDCVKTTHNFKTRTLPGYTYADWEQVSLPLAIRKEKLSIIHCTANTAPIVCPAPLLLTLHDVIFLEKSSLGGSAYQNYGNMYRRRIVPGAIRNAAHLITVSHSEKQIITDTCRVDPDKISVIYNGVSEHFHNRHQAADKENLRKKLKLPAQFILFHGNTAPKKNTTNVIKAYIRYCYEFRDTLPIVITDYPADLVMRVLRETGDMHFAPSFFFTGYVSSDDMPLLYSCASLFLYPSLRESFGLPILEAMASGVPVISSDRAAMVEIAGGAASLVNPEDPQEIAAALIGLHGDSDERNWLIGQGLERAKAFSWKTTALQVMKLYHRFGS